MLFSLIPKRPRVAKPASRLRNSLKTLVQIVVLWSVALGLMPFAIEWFERSMSWPGFQPMPWFGGAVFVAASLIGLVAANVLVRDGHGTPLPLDTTREFVVAGPYRYVRNPMAMCGILQAVGVGLWLGSPGVIGYAVLGGTLWQCLARPWEEADMQERFGEPYRRYRDGVTCWIPRLRPYSGAAQANPSGSPQLTPITESECPDRIEGISSYPLPKNTNVTSTKIGIRIETLYPM